MVYDHCESGLFLEPLEPAVLQDSQERASDTVWCSIERHSFWRLDPPRLYMWPGRRRWDSNPRWPCDHNGFRDRPIRPLSHSSKCTFVCRLTIAAGDSQTNRQWYRQETGWSGPRSLTPCGEEVGQQESGLPGQYPGCHRQLVVEAGIVAELVQRATGARLRVDRPEHEPPRPSG
jgi:hypothetical protein